MENIMMKNKKYYIKLIVIFFSETFPNMLTKSVWSWWYFCLLWSCALLWRYVDPILGWVPKDTSNVEVLLSTLL